MADNLIEILIKFGLDKSKAEEASRELRRLGETSAASGNCAAVVGYINGVAVKTNATYLPGATMTTSMTTYTTENVAKGYCFYKYFRRQALTP